NQRAAAAREGARPVYAPHSEIEAGRCVEEARRPPGKERREEKIDSTAKPLVFVHGFACTHADWRLQLAEFGEEHDIFAPDLRGHGRTRGPKTAPSKPTARTSPRCSKART